MQAPAEPFSLSPDLPQRIMTPTPVHRRRVRPGALLQLALFVLLQTALVGAPVATALNATTVSMVCQGDHEKCGCAPSRVAAGTCCCAISSLPPCCKKKALEKAQAQKVEITQLPCGTEQVLTTQATGPFVPAFFTPPQQFPVPHRYPDLSPEAPSDRALRHSAPPAEIHPSC